MLAGYPPPICAGIRSWVYRVTAMSRRCCVLTFAEERQGLEHLRSIPKGINVDDTLPPIVLKFRWNTFYRANPAATRPQIEAFRDIIDDRYGQLFVPPAR